MGGCRFLPWMNDDKPVYGVPSDPRVTVTPISEYEEEENDEGTDVIPGPEEDEVFSPERNLYQCMYGPPMDREILRDGEEK